MIHTERPTDPDPSVLRDFDRAAGVRDAIAALVTHHTRGETNSTRPHGLGYCDCEELWTRLHALADAIERGER